MTFSIELNQEQINNLLEQIKIHLNSNPKSMSYINVHPDDLIASLYLRESKMIPNIVIRIAGGGVF